MIFNSYCCYEGDDAHAMLDVMIASPIVRWGYEARPWSLHEVVAAHGAIADGATIMVDVHVLHEAVPRMRGSLHICDTPSASAERLADLGWGHFDSARVHRAWWLAEPIELALGASLDGSAVSHGIGDAATSGLALAVVERPVSRKRIGSRRSLRR